MLAFYFSSAIRCSMGQINDSGAFWPRDDRLFDFFINLLLPEDISFPSNVWLCVRNPTVWPFKWKPSNSIIFLWQFFKAYFWPFESWDNGDIKLWATFSYKNKTSSEILSCGTIYLVCSSNFESSDEIQLRLANLLSFACYCAQIESLLASWKKYDGATN